MGLADEIAEINVDLPAFGKPTSPTSAINLSSRITLDSSPGKPGSAYLGVRFVGVAKLLLPLPPFPPFATIACFPSLSRSKRILLSMLLFIIVPTGTLMITSVPFLPSLSELPPGSPFPAMYFLLYLVSSNVFKL